MKFQKFAVLLALGASLMSSSKASVVTLSGSRIAPVLERDDGSIAANSLILVGTLSGAPASSSVADIAAVFDVFSSTSSNASGTFNTTVVNTAASAFNGLPVHLWAFDTNNMATATQHGLFTNPNAPPSSDDEWIFPIHTGTGTDAIVIGTVSLLTEGDATFTPGVQFNATPGRITLAPIPEPSGALLLGLSLSLLAIRRR